MTGLSVVAMVGFRGAGVPDVPVPEITGLFGFNGQYQVTFPTRILSSAYLALSVAL